MHQKYSDYNSLTQVSNTIHNLWLYKLRLNLHQRFTHNIQVKLIGVKQIYCPYRLKQHMCHSHRLLLSA